MDAVTIIGLGNIGSSLVSLVARIDGLAAITLIDPDEYVESNLTRQAIDNSAIGSKKVEVQAAKIEAINPLIKVQAIAERIENVPVTKLRNSVVIACVDNRGARQSINRIAWRLDCPWIDAAVDAPSLVRVNVYLPSQSSPCLECAWDEKSYDLLEQEYACNTGKLSVSATSTSAELGALAASLQAVELRKLLTKSATNSELVSAQLMLDTMTYERHLARFEYSKHCRFDHTTWDIEAMDMQPDKNTIADLFDAVDADSDSTIRLEGHSFASYLDCLKCGRRSSIGLSLYARLNSDIRQCGCGGRMYSTGYFSFEALRKSDLSRANLNLTLARLGFRYGDVISVGGTSGTERHIEIGEGTNVE